MYFQKSNFVILLLQFTYNFVLNKRKQQVGFNLGQQSADVGVIPFIANMATDDDDDDDDDDRSRSPKRTQ